MLFNSYLFILLFLPLCLTGWFTLNRFGCCRIAQTFLLLMSLWFYGHYNIYYLPLILCSVACNYAVYCFLCRKKSRLILWTGLAVNIGLLLYFKYADFFLRGMNLLCRTDFNLLHVVLPLGISFFTFQQISFLVDAWRGEVPRYGFLLYASYVCYFPQLIAGPIVTHDELIPQFMDEGKKQLNWENLAKGIYIFTLGLSKKVLLADVFGRAVDWGYANYDGIHSELALLVILAYSFQIYFDFSGYCDMASGIAKMMNIELPVNFNSPYKALTITEFWERWHSTLTRFLTKYVYIPLGGSRKGEARTYLNILIVFFISGFWHGAGLNFIIWGLCHGVFMILTRRYRAFFARLHPVLCYLITFVFLNVTWVFFRAESLPQAVKILRRAAVFHFQELPDEFIDCFQMPGFDFLVKNSRAVFSLSPFYSVLIPLYFVLAVVLVLGTRNVQERAECFAPTKARLFVTVFLLILCLNCFSAVSPFLYFNF